MNPISPQYKRSLPLSHPSLTSQSLQRISIDPSARNINYSNSTSQKKISNTTIPLSTDIPSLISIKKSPSSQIDIRYKKKSKYHTKITIPREQSQYVPNGQKKVKKTNQNIYPKPQLFSQLSQSYCQCPEGEIQKTEQKTNYLESILYEKQLQKRGLIEKIIELQQDAIDFNKQVQDWQYLKTKQNQQTIKDIKLAKALKQVYREIFDIESNAEVWQKQKQILHEWMYYKIKYG